MTDDERTRLEELWTRFVAREPLGADERAALAVALEGDEVVRRRLVHDLQMNGALRAAGEIERGQEGVIDAVKALVAAASRTEEVVAAVRRQLEARAARPRPAHTGVPSSGSAPMRAAATAAAATGAPGAAASAPSRRVRASRLWAAAFLVAGGAAALVLLRARTERQGTPAPAVAEREPGAAPGAAAPGAAGEPAAGGLARPAPPAGGAHQRPATTARFEEVEGLAYRHGGDGIRRATRALELGPGDWVSTSGTASRARLVGPGGSRISLEGEAVVALTPVAPQAGGTRLFLAHGRVIAVVPGAPGGPPLMLTSPHVVVTGEGTVRLDVGGALTRVEVKSGSARVSALGAQRVTEIRAGHFALVRADDPQPVAVQTTPREALLLTGPDDTKEEPPPPGGLRGSEERMRARLERLGFQVVVTNASALSPEQARAAALLVLSSSVSSVQLGPSFAELPVPMLVLESTGFEQLGLTGRRWRRDVGAAPPVTEIVIEDPAHPLAAGLSGSVKVLSTPLNLRWAAPPPSASLIATYAGARDYAVLLFGYEAGAPMASGIAPARRVGLFLGNGRVIRALTDQGWRLFDAAALWAAGG